MKTLYITHNDLDAIGSIIVANLFSLNIDDYRFCNYTDIYNDDETEVILQLEDHYDRILLVDLACTAVLYDFLSERTDILGVFDHHERTEAVKDRKGVSFDLTKSGTEIFANAVGSDLCFKWTQFIEAVTAYDTWQLDHPLRELGENINRLFYGSLNWADNVRQTYGQYKGFIESQVSKLLDKNLEEYAFSDWELQKIEAAKQKEIRAYHDAKANMIRREDDKGNSYLLFHGSTKISHICSRLLAEEEGVDYVVAINTYSGTKKKRVNGRVSVRCLSPFDVTTLKGIEGHKEAGGGTFTLINLKKLWYNRDTHLGYKEV